jgi:hypothetical protein
MYIPTQGATYSSPRVMNGLLMIHLTGSLGNWGAIREHLRADRVFTVLVPVLYNSE